MYKHAKTVSQNPLKTIPSKRIKKSSVRLLVKNKKKKATSIGSWVFNPKYKKEKMYPIVTTNPTNPNFNKKSMY